MDHSLTKKPAAKAIALILSLAMLATTPFMVNAPAARAAEDGNLTSTQGVYWFDPHEVGRDLTDTYVYDEELLKGDSLAYNDKLATMTYELAIASISSEREDKTPAGYANKSRNLRAYLEDNGFVDFDTNRYYKEKMTTETMGVACAHKKIVDNGKTYTLLAIVPRSAGYEAEWGGNFVMNETDEDTGDSAGFRHGKEIVLDYAKEYIEKYGISGDIKVWTSGYSRGAGVTNQVAAAILNRPNEVLGSSIDLTPENFYCYTYGTPKAASSVAGTEGDCTDSRFDYIHNVWEPYDIVTVAPPKNFGFARYGTDDHYASADRKARMLEFLEVTNKDIYDLYTDGGDPDGFTPMTIDMEALLDGEFKLTEDPDSYLPDDQVDFMEMMEDSLVEAVGGREEYSKEYYQAAMKDFGGYLFSHLGNMSALVDGIKADKFTPYMIGFVYATYMLERYKDMTFDRDTIRRIQEEIDALQDQIAEMEAAGEEVPDELIEALEDLEDQLAAGRTWGSVVEFAQGVSGILFGHVLASGLTEAGLPDEDAELYDRLTGVDEAGALSRLIAYLMLYDDRQTQQVISFTTVTQQTKHMATFIGNASSYMRPHNNEVILSWLRTLDPNYDDFEKENDAQIAGYRRLYIEQPTGVSVTGTVKDESGAVVAEFKDGKITSRTDHWIGITTCDTGSWLRIPLDQTYKVDLKVSKDTKLNLKATEYSVYEGKEVRTVKKDNKLNWTGLSVKKTDKVTWVISKVPGSAYKLASNAYYYIEKTSPKSNVLLAKGIASGSKAVKIQWNKVSGADRYVIYFSKCDTKNTKYALKRIKTVKAGKLTWTKTGLKKNKMYKFRVVAQKKVNGKYKDLAKSKVSHAITANQMKGFTNPKQLKLNKTKVSLKAGASFKIKASASAVKSGKKFIDHSAKFRYITDNKTIATVSSKGTVKAVAAGNCKIYVQTVNGIWKSISVTVK